MKMQCLWPKLVILWLLPSFTNAEGLKYFENEINYWSSKEKSESIKSSKKIETSKKQDFEWDKYLNPENDEFFKEGNYIPPAPFMEVYRRPTKKNVLMWDAYIKKRNLVHTRAMDKMKLYLGNVDKSLDPQKEKSKFVRDESVRKSFKGKYVVFYFDSSCPSCKAMYPEVNRLVQIGVMVEAVRLDSGNDVVPGLALPWQKIKPGEQEKLKIKAWPLTLIVDEKQKRVARVTGVKTVEELRDLVKKL